MIIHLNGSAKNLQQSLPYLRQIVHIIHDNGHTLARDWIEAANYRDKHDVPDTEVDWKEIFQQNMDAIARADIVIAEVSEYRFSQGYQTAIALQHKKPTLLVSRDPKATKETLAPGNANELLRAEMYRNKEDLEKIVGDFIKDNTFANKDMRFNFFIDRKIYNYLRWASYQSGRTKSEVLRELIQREIDKNVID